MPESAETFDDTYKRQMTTEEIGGHLSFIVTGPAVRLFYINIPVLRISV